MAINNNLLETKAFIDEFNKTWVEHKNNLLEAAKAGKQFSEAIRIPGNYIKGLKSLVIHHEKLATSGKKHYDVVTEYDKRRKKEIETNIRWQKHLAKEEKAVERIAKAKEREAKRIEKALVREQKNLERTQGTYNRIQQRVHKLTLQYNDLAAKKELGMKLTSAELSSLKQLQGQLTAYTSALKKVDANVGKHQRNVGNYKSAYDGLGISVQQIAREMPAFANSIQTGFMAISNNIPMLVDEINRLKDANKELIAQGKPTKNLYKSLAAAVFNWQTLISIGVTLLTVYGKEIVEWAADLMTGNKALSFTVETQKKLNEQSNKMTSEVIPKLNALVKVVRDVNSTEEQRKSAMEALNKEYPDFNANILLEKDNTELVNKEVDKYIEKINKKAKAQAAMSMLQEKYNELIILEEKTKKAFIKTGKTEVETLEQQKKAYSELIDEARSSSRNRSRGGAIALGAQKVRKAMEEQAEKQKEINNLTKIYINNTDDFVGGQKKINKSVRDRVKALGFETYKTKNLREEIEEYIEVLKKTKDMYINNTSESKKLQYQIDELTKALQNQIDVVGELDDMQAKAMGANSIIKHRKEEEEQLKRLKKSTEDYLNSFSSDFFNDFGINSLEIFTKVEENGKTMFQNLWDGADTTGKKVAVVFNAVSSVVQDVMNRIAISHKQEMTDLETKKELSIKYANDSASAREEIERQYEDKRRKIQARQAKAQQDLAIFNTVTNTAQAIVSTLANVAFPANIPLSVLIGSLGMAQVAVIKNSEIPKFKDGTRNFKGGLAVLGDGGVNEYAVTPKGNVIRSEDTDTLYKLPKGTDVYKNENDFLGFLNKELLGNGIKPLNKHLLPSIEFPKQKSLTKKEIKEAFSESLKNLEYVMSNQPIVLKSKSGQVTGVYYKRSIGDGIEV